jgi:outer membrane protein TolC
VVPAPERRLKRLSENQLTEAPRADTIRYSSPDGAPVGVISLWEDIVKGVGVSVSVGLAVAVGLTPSGCASWYAARADRDVGRLLADYGRRHAVRPVSLEDVPDTPAGWDAEIERRLPPPPDWVRTPTTRPATLTLADALSTAVVLNRDYLFRRETLFLTALSLTGAAHRFSPRPSASVEAGLSIGPAVDDTFSHAAIAQVSQILLYGGTLTLRGRTDGSHPIETGAAPDVYRTSGAVELTQPLLAGFGYEVSHDPLIQARHDLIYDLRSFFQYRQDFSIQVSQAYWGLQGLRERVRNQERSLERLKELKKRADARFAKGAAEALDRFRAAAEVLRADNDLKDARRAYDFALDQFKVQLGLPPETEIEVADDRPPFRRLDPDLARAIRAAVANRVDLRNAQDRVDDSQRGVRIARNALLGALDLTARYEENAAGTEFSSQRWDRGRAFVGLRLALPLDRTLERNAYRRALIDVDRVRREAGLVQDQVLVDVRERVRQLRIADSTVELQRQSIEELKRELEMANIRLERGEASNRDVVDAEARLLDAENRLVQAEVDHAIARLRFWRSIGTLAIDEKGMWQE